MKRYAAILAALTPFLAAARHRAKAPRGRARPPLSPALRQLQEEEAAFRLLQHYSAETAYGLGGAQPGEDAWST